jgi:hypothetical protein
MIGAIWLCLYFCYAKSSLFYFLVSNWPMGSEGKELVTLLREAN